MTSTSRRDLIAPVALLWALAYGAVQLSWVIGDAPDFGRIGTDLMVFPGQGAVVLCLTAAAVAASYLRPPRSRRPVLAGWAVSVALVMSCPVLLLDVVGGLLPGFGIPTSLPGFLSRAGCFLTAVLLALATRSYQRRHWTDCEICGRSGRPPTPDAAVPGWSFLAAYAAVTGCVVRIASQFALGFGSDADLASTLVFELGFILGGTMLPLALVHQWGRALPRRLVLWPAAIISLGLVVYFGVGIGQLAAETITGANPADGLPLWFLWIAMPAYWVWGVGLGIAALSYARMTREPCPKCGR